MKKSVKLGLKIAGLSVAWIPTSVCALATIDVCTTLNSRAPLNKRFFRDSLSEDAKEAPITNLAMLGSHDSLSNCITINSKNDPYSPQTTDLSEIARWIGPGAMVRLSRAQMDDVYTQLNAGVRYVDARITCIDGKYYTHHTMISNSLEFYLEQILRWLHENPGEFIFFHIYYFNYEGLNQDKESEAFKTARDNAWTKLHDFIANYKPYGRSLFDYDYTLNSENPQFGDLTYNRVTKSGTDAGAVIFFSSDDVREAKTSEWCYKHMKITTDSEGNAKKWIINPCALSMKASNVIATINDAVKETKSLTDDERKQTLRYVQTQTTPNINEIPQTLVAWSLLQKAHDHNAYMLRKSGIDWNETFKWMPIYMSDFTTDNTNGFCQEVIDKASAFNSKL